MPPLPRARCHGCGRDTALRRGDLLREHRTRDGQLCPTSGEAMHEPSQDAPWQCQGCGRVFNTVADWNTHRREWH